MGNNAEIRQRMNTYRSILLVINWIGSIILVITGFIMMNILGGFAFFIIIAAILLGIVGHFLINVALAIPFILLNNGDILESMKGNSPSNNVSKPASTIKYKGVKPSSGETGDEYIVTFDTPLRGDASESSFIKKPLKVGDKVYYQYSVNDSDYFYVNTSDSQEGWCLAGHLKKS